MAKGKGTKGIKYLMTKEKNNNAIFGFGFKKSN
jgi:hypothetical protein